MTDLAKLDKVLKAKLGQDTSQIDGDLNPFVGTALSALYGGASLIGVRPPEYLKEWEAQHPGLSTLGSMVGYAAPYGVYGKVMSKVVPSRYMKWVDKVAPAEDAAKMPFRATAKRELLRWAPAEAYRTGAAATLGPLLAEATGNEYAGLGDVATQSAFDLAIGSGIMGGISKLKAAGAVEGKAISRQQRMQKVKAQLAEATDEDTRLGLREELEAHEAAVRKETRRKGERYVGGIGELHEGSARSLDRLFRLRAKSQHLKVRRFVAPGKNSGFATAEDYQKIMDLSDLRGNLEVVQTPRHVQGLTRQGSRHIRMAVRNNLELIDSERRIWAGRDPSDGLFVVAHQLDDAGKSWNIWKTNDVARWAPEGTKWAKIATQTGTLWGQRSIPRERIGVDIFDKTLDAGDYVDLTHTLIDEAGTGLPKKSLVRKVGERLLGKVPEHLRNSELKAGISRFVGDFILPASHQFKGSRAATKAMMMARASLDAAEQRIQHMFLGEPDPKNVSSLWRAAWSGTQFEGGRGVKKILGEIAAEGPKQLAAFNAKIDTRVTAEQAMDLFGANAKVAKLSKELEDVMDRLFDDYVKLDAYAREILPESVVKDLPKPKKLEGHSGFSHVWEGDFRTEILRGNKVVGYGGGKQPGLAKKEAERIVGIAPKSEGPLRIGRTFKVNDFEGDLRLLQGLSKDDQAVFGTLRQRSKLAKAPPKRMHKDRTGAIGYKGYKEVRDLKTLQELALMNIRGYSKQIAKLTTKIMAQPELDRLIVQDPKMAVRLKERLDKMFGIKGPIAQAIDNTVDVVLAPVLGGQSASKISQALNKYSFGLSLGFVNTGFNMANLLGVAQTMFPHLSWITTAAPSRVSAAYDFLPIFDGKTVRPMGILNSGKLVGQVWRSMGNPDKELKQAFERGMAEGTIEPRFIEAFVGEKSQFKRNMIGALASKGGVADAIELAATWLPGQTEKLARGMAFTTGWEFGKRVLGIIDDELLYRFAAKFTDNTQFLYSMGDRPIMFTGPVGASYGLFKTWMMNYLAWLGTYAGEGFVHGNWKPFLWTFGTTGTIGGVGALAGLSGLDAVSEWLNDKPAIENTYRMFNFDGAEGDDPNTLLSDLVYFGVPRALGFSLQNQVAMPGVDFAHDASMLFSIPWMDRMKYLWRAVGEGWNHYATTGESPFVDKRTQELLIKATAPRTLERLWQATQEKALESLASGYPVVDWGQGWAGLYERLLYASGVNPVGIEKAYEVRSRLWKDQDERRKMVTTLGKELAKILQGEGDAGQFEHLMTKASNELGDVSSVMRSAMAVLRKEQQDSIERQFSPEAWLEYDELGLLPRGR